MNVANARSARAGWQAREATTPRLIDLAYAIRRRVLAVLRIRTRGVKVIACDTEGRVLLIRNHYGRTEHYVLPGGGVDRGETPIAAAARELMEETGCRADALTHFATYAAHHEGKRDTVHLFTCVTSDMPRPDDVEVAEAGFFALADLPATTSPATRRRLMEWSGERAVGGSW